MVGGIGEARLFCSSDDWYLLVLDVFMLVLMWIYELYGFWRDPRSTTGTSSWSTNRVTSAVIVSSCFY